MLRIAVFIRHSYLLVVLADQDAIREEARRRHVAVLGKIGRQSRKLILLQAAADDMAAILGHGPA